MPVNSPLFDDINDAQWLWYLHNFMKDNDEKFDFQRNIIEYHAGFIAPEAVNRVRKMREGKEKAIKISNEDFNKNLASMFGRDLQGNTSDKEAPKQATLADYRYWENILTE